MRHYLLVDANGEVIGPATCSGGFSEDCSLSDPGSKHPLVTNHHKAAQLIPGFDRFVEYECPCSANSVDCLCPHTRSANAYADGQVLRTKPELTLLLDDVPVVGQDPVVIAPGATVVLKLQSAVPDGHQVIVQSTGAVTILSAASTLVFTGGVTDGVTLTAPAHALTGVVGGNSKYVPCFSLQLKANA